MVTFYCTCFYSRFLFFVPRSLLTLEVNERNECRKCITCPNMLFFSLSFLLISLSPSHFDADERSVVWNVIWFMNIDACLCQWCNYNQNARCILPCACGGGNLSGEFGISCSFCVSLPLLVLFSLSPFAVFSWLPLFLLGHFTAAQSLV